MENSNENTFGGVLATAIGCVVIGGLHYLADRSLFAIILFSTAAIGIIAFYILRQTVWKSTEILEEDICKRLKKAGFQFELFCLSCKKNCMQKERRMSAQG